MEGHESLMRHLRESAEELPNVYDVVGNQANAVPGCQV
jgi:hypothetical protein